MAGVRTRFGQPVASEIPRYVQFGVTYDW
jgi:hypothetical protein